MRGEQIMINEEKIYEKLIRKLERINIKAVKSIGAEFEGGICAESLEDLQEWYDTYRLEIGYDGSVIVRKPDNVRCNWLHDVEIRYWSEDPREMIDFARDLWELGFRQNETCGNHLHFKFNNNELAIMFLMKLENIKKFQHYYAKKFKNNEKYLARFRNNYSRAIITYNDVHSNFNGNRYFSFNVLSYWENETFEIRLPPYADSWVEWSEMMIFTIRVLEYILRPLAENNKIILEIDDTKIVNMIDKLNNNINNKPRKPRIIVRRIIIE
jgi:hypothetical protein